MAGDDKFTADVIDRLELKAISKWGIGVDGIDRAHAAAKGIPVTNTPGAFDEEVADVAYGYIVMLLRQLHVIHEGVRDGGWPKPPGHSLGGLRLGVIGLGGIGRAVVREASSLRWTSSVRIPCPRAGGCRDRRLHDHGDR